MRRLLILSFIFNSACSLYQSEGRKFLEKQALQFAASANLQSCGHNAMGEEWLQVSSTDSAVVYGSENEEFTLRVTPRASTFNCTFRFSSVQEMVERTDSAVELTLEQMALGPGEFAFHPISPLK